MSILYITRGLPGSGKTTRAKAWVAEDRDVRARVNLDDLRDMLHGGRFVPGGTERVVVGERDVMVEDLLRRGIDVVDDATNLRSRDLRRRKELANRVGAEVRIWDLTDVDVETCIARDAQREKPVGEAVIRDKYMRFVHKRPYPLPVPELDDAPVGPAPYVRPDVPDGAPVVIVDIDGTVATMADRSPYDMTRVSEDTPNTPVITVVQALRAAGNDLLFMSGRTEDGREATEAWLDEHVGGAYIGPFMRAVGDGRRDSEMKAELFDQNVRTAYDVVCVIDDRQQVVDMWRELGLTVLQVAEGKF